MSDYNQPIIEEFRANEGRVGGIFEGARLLLLTTTGARSGRAHTTPTAYAEDAGRLIIFATNSGQPTAPAWLHNLRANPAVIVERGTERFKAVATELTGPERDRLYAEQSRRDPSFATYQQGTDRVIQVVAMVPSRVGAATAQLREIHNGLRRELADLRAAVDAHLQGEPLELPQPVEELRRHCLSFCSALHAHHTREDGVLPRLAQAFPELEPAFTRLRQEHDRVATLNTQIAEVVEQLAAGSNAPADALHLSDNLTRLASDLEAHFTYEENHLGPALDAA